MKRMRDELSRVEDADVARVLARALIEAAAVGDVTQSSEDAVAGAYEAVLRGMTCHRLAGPKPSHGLLFGPSIERGNEPADARFDTLLAVRQAKEGWLVYLRSMDEAEADLAKAIAKLNAERATHWPVEFKADYLAPLKLTATKEAVLKTFGQRRLTILTGGPGTGKTRTICGMLMVAREAGGLRDSGQVAVLAPTHRARLRVKQELLEFDLPELQGIEPQTVHAFIRDSRDEGAARLVVVDEASMVDLVLFQRLLDSLHEDASLVIVGDPEQLPSVEVGSVLADLTRATSLDPALCNLTDGHRFDREGRIAKIAQAIHDNQPEHVPAEPVTEPKHIITRLLAGGATNPYVQVVKGAVREAKLPPDGRVEAMRTLLETFGRLRLLCSHRVGPVGSQALSRLIMRELGVADARSDGAVIMVTRNDLDLGITNGETGIVCGGMAYFQVGDHIRAFGLAQLPEYVPAFATTIHAAQGSQYAEVFVVLGKSERNQFVTREMVYTAVTRAQKEVTIFAAEGAVANALDVRVDRASGLEYRLG